MEMGEAGRFTATCRLQQGEHKGFRNLEGHRETESPPLLLSLEGSLICYSIKRYQSVSLHVRLVLLLFASGATTVYTQIYRTINQHYPIGCNAREELH
ncbi:hypothetical protein ALC53_06814 [Atta colombica]|uniref:Uncharacterized protein n=1 Tax=Atta colombica TaxID=520822 RepID=A0A195BEK1_9HYME|nr:hypothetical protein ALC53_06814 [Atta colombica]